MGEKSLYCCWEWTQVQPLQKSGRNFLKKIKLKRELSYDLDISVLGIDPNDSISANQTTTYAFMFVIIPTITKLEVSSM